MTLYEIIVLAHSMLRWLLIFSLLITGIIYFRKWRKNLQFFNPNRIFYKITLGLFYIQILLGVYLYFTSPKVHFSTTTISISIFRFFTIIHPLIMFFSSIILTVGFFKVMSIQHSVERLRVGFWYLLISLLMILAALPMHSIAKFTNML